MLENDLIEKIANSHPKLWFCLLIIFILYLILDKLSNVIFNLSKLKAKIYLPLAQNFKFIQLQRAAIKYDIQGKVNEGISSISNELLSNNIKPLEINWIKTQTTENFIEEGKILIRIRPLKNQDDNIINVIRPYLESVIIPKSKIYLQDSQKNAIIDFSTKEVLSKNEKILDRFHCTFYLPNCKKYKRLEDYFKKMETVNKRGLFYSVFITSLEFSAEKSRFIKTSLSEDYLKILDHLIKFSQGIGNFEEKDSSKWRYGGSTLSYNMLLVAAPSKANLGDYRPYLRRAEEKLKSSDLLFVAFSNDEKKFGNLVARNIEKNLEVKLIDELITKYDYRKNFGGIVRVYVKK